mgnify:CR=1 FL=1
MTIARMYLAIAGGDMDGALRLLQEFLSTVPYCDNTNYEGHYSNLFYIIFSLFGMYVDVEVRIPERFFLSGLQVVKVGINFDVEKHTLGDYINHR